MRPNLSLEHIATALAALGTSVIVGCGGSEPAAQAPVQSVEVASPPATGPAAVSVGVAAPAAPAAVVVAPAAPTAPALGVAAMGTGTVAATVAKPGTPAVAVTVKPKTPAKKGSNAQASCGAGTCSAAK